jgi:eukaryotic-like serine/threonine-protein kinase
MNRCPACGTTYPDDARFCTRDGTRLLTQSGNPALTPVGSPAVNSPAPAAPESPTPGRTPRPTASPARGDTTAPLTHFNLVGKVLQGRYEIVKKVGEGGMSFVYLANDIATRERYAIKVLSAALSQDANAMARLRREASLGMRLAHPNICHIIRLGETEDGLVYVVMPFVEGEILADRTNARGNLPLHEVTSLVRDMSIGLNVAHELKIVHRDLKPENVMVCRGGDGRDYAVVLDFGLAKERKAGAELQKLTATGIILGTPEFMSPEQLRGKPLDARTDIYSLALMTYEMLTGKLPFQGRTQQETMIARLRSDPTPLRKIRPELDFPEAVERVLAKALQRNPDDRYQTTIEFSDAFTAAARLSGGSAPGGTETGLLGKLFGR